MPAGSSRLHDQTIAVIGMSCRLPGAAGLDEYWSLLLQERCSVSEIGSDRWAIERFYHPRRGEPGRSYTLAAGLIEAPNGFDAGAFRIAPREAEQMDPQQRLLLELVWEALEDAGLPPSTLAGQPVGVFVGASSVDGYTRAVGDASGIDTHFMTGNTASIIANRISYIYDLRGPSLTIDTACSSSLVALDAAVRALARGEIDTAVVAGVNILGAPQAFYGFSRAGMLSPTGLCRPFAAAADGYVRAEGGAVLVLSRLDAARSNGRPPRVVLGPTGVNSDGRTVGLSLPSTDAQRRLLERLYGEAGIDPNDLAFVEAHGTGTRVGDPAEAEAIGRALGQKRDAPLPVGSVKSNIGHLEPASGLAGMIKAVLAIEHRVLPATLHLDTINPDIPFEALNLVPARGPVALPPGPLTAGVSSFGFGGTNAHAVLRAPRPDEMPEATSEAPARALVLSAHGEEALRSLAGRYAEALELADADPVRIARHAAHERELLPHRLALPLSDDAAAELRRFAEGDRAAQLVSARGESDAGPICFAFSGNGSQFAGMGLRAYRASRPFRDAFDEVDARYRALAGWSLAEALQDQALEERLPATSTAQPLLFAVQVALTAALAADGLVPAMVIGHSVGEVAAALAAGMVSLDQAVRIIHWRSRCQEQLRGLGTMAVLMLGREEAEAVLAEAGLHDTVVAAVNSPVCVTVSGPKDQIELLLKLAKQRRVAAQRVGVDYPFHSPLTAPIEAPLKAALADTVAAESRIPFISSVTGGPLTGPALDAEYWWRNIRQPVDFAAAARTALELDAGIFVEIGPRPVLTGHLRDIAKAAEREAAILPTLDNKAGEDGSDPVERAVLQVLLRGGAVDRRPLFGDRPTGRRQALPHYPWQRRDLRQVATPERIDLSLAKPAHPLLGARLGEGTPEWHGLLDPGLLPYLADHKVAGEVVVPGAALLEMAVAAGRTWFGADAVEVEDFDIIQAMMIAEGTTRETWLRLAPGTGAVEILGRQRMAGEEWTLHARGRVGPSPVATAPDHGAGDDSTLRPVDPAAIYAAAGSAGIDYGPAFRRATAIATDDERRITVDLAPEAADNGLYTAPHALHPTALDAAFHGLFALYGRLGGGEGGAFLPVRFASLRVYQSSPAARARLDLRRATARSILVDIALEDEAGTVVAELRGARFQRSALRLAAGDELLYRSVRQPWDDGRAGVAAAELEQAVAGLLDRHEAGDDWLLLTAWARSMAHRAVRAVAGSARFTVERLCRGGRLAPAAVPHFEALLKVLAEFGLATEQDGAWRLSPARLPSPPAILRSILAAHPERGAETVMAARLSRDLVAALRSGETLRFSKGVEAHARAASPLLPLAAELVGRLAADRAMPLALLLVDPEGELVPALLPLIRSGALTVAVTGPEPKALAGLAARTQRLPGLRILDEQTTVSPGGFDLALSVGTMAAGDPAKLGQPLAGLLRPGAAAVTIDTIPDTVTALLLDGMADNLTSQDGLAQAGFRPAVRHRAGTPGAAAQLVVWDRPAVDVPAEPAGPILIRPADTELLADLADRLRGRGHPVRIDPAAAAAEGDTVLLPLMLDAARDPVAFLTKAILAVRAEAEALPAKATLWLVARCGKLNGKADGGRGLAEALAAFARTLANEQSGLAIRFATLAPALPDEAAAAALAGVIGSAETEVEVDRDGIFVSRVEAVRPAPQDAPAEDRAARLALSAPGSLGRIGWVAAERQAPGPEEIEIEVAASGLNFRDVMFSLGLLPDDYLEDGFAGPTLGFECAGTVRRVGAAVTDLREGDRVMAFAPAAFATHVTIPAQVAMRVPEGVDLAAAATMPVAFVTAWYALVHQARLGRGETVLIHGAAGGVGLAALQIAKLRGATVVATAGNEDKRALAQLLGADLVLDSRSLAFADEIRWKLGGVDVVLNSLSGDAMRRSLRALKPFGRFVELGKRDFVADTAVGLRAFARNVSYFGVDADQLLNAQPGLTKRLLRELDRLFAQRRLTPLAHRVFPADQAEDAFRLMQGAGHIGKIVITPPREIPAAPAAEARFEAQDTGFHLVAGGTGGFGFATALWLAEHGAKTIVVASRRGTLGPTEKAQAERLAKQGVTLAAERLDVTDRAACEKLLAGLERRHGPLRGIIHAAMVLDDGLLRDLDAARIERVLAPKIKGAIHLDLVSRTREPDYFVLFSSATTLIGNPGQANYVAANAYLEALARTRRAQGLPALAVSWGAIADAGVLARDAAKGDALKRRIGRSSLKAAEALAQLGRLLARPAETPAEAVVACARIDWQAATRELPILATPRLASMADGRRAEAAEAEVDLAAMIAGRSDAEAQAIVTETMLGEIGRILRMPPADIDPDRAFAELGMDSLMGLELDSAMQNRYGIDLPFLSIGAGLTLTELSGRIVAKLRGGAPAAGPEAQPPGEAAQLIAQHVEADLEADAAVLVREAVRDRAKTTRRVLG
ncbi:SDR family NAD(P)-dependent oxidoreductase [Mycobacterium sp. KBS0706]|uniref:type I polyketide synthase n=1 Tax=Mycobacterium sp. KBS0706 TaxID=2578109 RepID=UPI00110FEA80|nr:type I polyketide synthase [Mycobacterium sp. KBS0706]TSD89685.1 SDR family NAD(P)-dependent oxidoreductase [Mycobacterium sp. KBS0706]